MTTKELLIDTAGKLFAAHGYDGVSTRMIADAAEVKLSAIHYHFGSKESLYIEAFKYAKTSAANTKFSDVLLETPSLAKTPAGQAEIIRNTVFRRFHDHFCSAKPKWLSQILVREILTPSSAMETISEKLFKPDNSCAVNFYRMVKPGASEDEASAWADMLHSSVFFYLMAKTPLEYVRGEGCLNSEFFKKSAEILARSMILELGLPLPADLQQEKE